MLEMKKILHGNKIIFLIYGIFLVMGAGILLFFTKSDIHLYTNKFHSAFWDFFYKNITHVGDGLTIAVLFVILLFLSFRKALVIGLSGAFGGLLAQFFKRVFFSDVNRPQAYFNGVADLYFVPGVNVHTTLSFPSGHTATAFALFIALALLSKRNGAKLFFLFVAFLIGYSRIYLSQHFLIDVYFGSLLGTISAIISVLLVSSSTKKWLDNSILKIVSK